DYEELADIAAYPFLDVHPSVLPKPTDRPASSSLDRIEVMVGGKENTPVSAVRPIHNASIDPHYAAFPAAGKGIKAPKLPPGRSLEGYELELSRCPIQDPVKDDGVALDLGLVVVSGVARVIGPRHF